jgi:hypothetical protein
VRLQQGKGSGRSGRQQQRQLQIGALRHAISQAVRSEFITGFSDCSIRGSSHIKGLPMKMTKLLVVAFCITLLTSCSMSKDTALAQAQISAFHSEFDAGSFQKIYSSSSPDLQKVESEGDFVKLLEVINRKLGNVKTSTQLTWRVFSGPSGTFVTIVNKSQFEHGSGDEQFVYRIHNGVAKLAGYHINSLALVTR